MIAGALQVNALATGDGLFAPAGAFGLALGFCTAPILTAGYIGTVALLLARRPGFMSFTAPAGRMSLTVYVGESVLMSLLYCGYGLRFFGQWGAFVVVLSGIVTWALLSSRLAVDEAVRPGAPREDRCAWDREVEPFDGRVSRGLRLRHINKP